MLDMSETMIQTIRDYFATQPVHKAWLFGSYARGEETPESDVDILVDFEKNAEIGLFEHARMIIALENILGKKVDLVPNGTLLPFAEKTAEHDKRLIYTRI